MRDSIWADDGDILIQTMVRPALCFTRVGA